MEELNKYIKELLEKKRLIEVTVHRTGSGWEFLRVSAENPERAVIKKAAELENISEGEVILDREGLTVFYRTKDLWVSAIREREQWEGHTAEVTEALQNNFINK
mgnify:CR=1 FL=1